MQSADGTDWYAMQPHAAAPDFAPASMGGQKDGYDGSAPGFGSGGGGGDHGSDSGNSGGDGGYNSAGALAYNQAQFQSFMPGYEERVTSVDGSSRTEGRIEVRHENGSGTMFYDTAQYAPPRGDYKVYEDRNGSQWYAVRGDAVVERKPVYENGKAVYDGEKLRTVNVETVRYHSTPSRYSAPAKRKPEIKAPKRKR